VSLGSAEALQIVLEAAQPLPKERAPLGPAALGRVLASALRAPQPSPRWDVSAMDGFALRAADAPGAKALGLPISGTALAGRPPLSLKPGCAASVMTGALIPWGADAVLPKELAYVHNGMLFPKAEAQVDKGDHIRVAGEELKAGAKVAEAGTRLSSRWIGFLNGLGIASAELVKAPRVAVLVSGDELLAAGSALKPGKIHDSNGPMLEAAFAEQGARCKARRLKDDPQALEMALAKALKDCDLVLLSGGVSVGDADYSKDVFAKLKVKTRFWGVAQKPGKPLYFGSKGKTLVFGLPGNPAAAWVCFHEYVRPAYWALQGLAPAAPQFALADKEPKRDAKKTLFLKARLGEAPAVAARLASPNARSKSDVHSAGQAPPLQASVQILNGQQSHMLQSLAQANALAVVKPGGKGRLLEVRPL
jgi:molybdopterin molybdotransferase